MTQRVTHAHTHSLILHYSHLAETVATQDVIELISSIIFVLFCS